MNWRNILTVYGKELRDMLRDRRTIISMIVVPTFVMPALMGVIIFVGIKVARDVASTAPTVMVLGGEDSPAVRVLMIMSAVERVGAGVTSQAGMVGPLSTVFLSVFLLGEPITPWMVAGTVLVMLGIWLLTRPQRSAT
jgi:drug/metabolite transporter (DMT)-like permease